MLFSGIDLGIQSGLIKFLLWIDGHLYGLFSKLYSMYFDMASHQVFSETGFDNVVYNLYIVAGVVALFLFAFTLLKNMVNIDGEKGTKQVADIVKKLAIMILLTCLVPTFFDFLTDFQNAILYKNVIPNIMLGSSTITVDIREGSIDGESTTYTMNADEASKAIFNTNVNYMAVKLIDGLMYPVDTSDISDDGVGGGKPVADMTEDVSEFWDAASTRNWGGIIGCGLGLVGGTIIAIVTYGAGSAAVPAIAAAACGGTLLTFHLGMEGLSNITAKHYSWAYAKQQMIFNGDFQQLTLFSDAVVNKDKEDVYMHYTPIISTIAIGMLVYMILSFCIDLAVRSAKLVFYQLMAPICFLLSIIPSKKDLISNWFKVTLTTWAEVFIRIALVCGIVLLVSQLDIDTVLVEGHPIVSALMVLGVVIFAKQIPKLLSDLTGFNSGNLKIGLKEKLAEGGAFMAGAVIGGGITAFTRNAVNKWGNKENWKNKNGRYTAGSVMKNLGAGFLSAGAGGVSAAFRSGKAGWNAKSVADMKKSASSGAVDSITARNKRAAYKANHGHGFINIIKDENGKKHLDGTVWNHVKDSWSDLKGWAGYDNLSTLKQQKTSYDQAMGYMSQLKKLAEGEASVQAYAGQLKALSEQKIDLDQILLDAQRDVAQRINNGEVIEDIDKAVEEKRQQLYAQSSAAHAVAYEAAERRYKIAVAQAIAANSKKGNYKAIMEQLNTLRRENMSDKVFASFNEMSQEILQSQWDSVGTEFGFENGDDFLAGATDEQIKTMWSRMKEDSGVFAWAFNDNQAKNASGDVAIAIAKKEAEERKKDK